MFKVFVFTKDLPSIIQSNEQAATAKNEEQYTLNKMIYIKLQNCCVSFFEAYFEGGTPKMYINQLKDVSNEVHFYDKIAGWGSAILPKIYFSASNF